MKRAKSGSTPGLVTAGNKPARLPRRVVCAVVTRPELTHTATCSPAGVAQKLNGFGVVRALPVPARCTWLQCLLEG